MATLLLLVIGLMRNTNTNLRQYTQKHYLPYESTGNARGLKK